MTTFKLENGELGFSTSDPGGTLEDATISQYTAFTVQVVRGVLVATSNFDTETVEATWVAPESESVSPAATQWELQMRVKQDPATSAGLAKFLYDNDSGETNQAVWFYMGLASGAAPKARGTVYVGPQDFGGAGQSVLYADLRFRLPARPELEYGDTADV